MFLCFFSDLIVYWCEVDLQLELNSEIFFHKTGVDELILQNFR